MPVFFSASSVEDNANSDPITYIAERVPPDGLLTKRGLDPEIERAPPNDHTPGHFQATMCAKKARLFRLADRAENSLREVKDLGEQAKTLMFSRLNACAAEMSKLVEGARDCLAVFLVN